MQKIGADQSALFLSENRMRCEGFLHFIGARLESIEQIAVAALEILEHFGELMGRGLRIERQDSVDDVIRARLVGGVEVSRLGCRPEWPDDHSRRIRAQIETQPVRKQGPWQEVLRRSVQRDSGAHSAEWRRFRASSHFAVQLANLGEAEQVGHCRLTAPVFIGAVGMQAIQTTARFRIDQRRG